MESDAKCIRDVDHHARACWWSTSESSEKCPRVLRGITSVPFESRLSADLIRICSEIVGTLSHVLETCRHCRCDVPWSTPFRMRGNYDLMSAVKITMLER